MIIGPVKRIEKMINRLGEGEIAGSNARRCFYRSALSCVPSASVSSGSSERLGLAGVAAPPALRHLSHGAENAYSASVRKGCLELLAEPRGQAQSTT